MSCNDENHIKSVVFCKYPGIYHHRRSQFIEGMEHDALNSKFSNKYKFS